MFLQSTQWLVSREYNKDLVGLGEELAVVLDNNLPGGAGLLDSRALGDGLAPLKETLEVLVVLQGLLKLLLNTLLLVRADEVETGQERSKGEISKGELCPQEEGALLVFGGASDVAEEDIDLLQLGKDFLTSLGALGGIQGNGGFEESRLGASTPVVDQVAGLGQLEGILGDEAIRIQKKTERGNRFVR